MPFRSLRGGGKEPVPKSKMESKMESKMGSPGFRRIFSRRKRVTQVALNTDMRFLLLFSLFLCLVCVRALVLHGSQSSRSPLVNWYAMEAKIDLKMADPRPSNHPFGQIPFLTDNGVEVFESGAILLYLADKYGGMNTPEARAEYTKWVVWSNSELDFLCFGKADERNFVQGTSLDKPSRSLDVLDDILGAQDFLCGDEWTGRLPLIFINPLFSILRPP